MKKIKIGDVFEISTPKGYAYLHYIKKDKTIGELVRVLPGLYSEEPTDIKKTVGSDELFYIFFPLSFAYKKGIVRLVNNCEASNYDVPKYMRTEHNVRGEFLGWHIVNTQTWERTLVKTLNAEQIKFSPWGVWNDTLLIERLTNNWSLEEWSN